jgi:hypothetical protein
MIEIIGGQQYQQDRARSMVLFCLNSLMPRLKDKLYIRVELKKNMCAETGNLGVCYWTDTNDRPRDFIIEVDASSRLRTLLITIAHEMVHAKQFARNEQKHLLNSANKVKWKGKDVDLLKVDYWELPWEIEAHGREVGLFVNWCGQHHLEEKYWTLDKNDI